MKTPIEQQQTGLRVRWMDIGFILGAILLLKIFYVAYAVFLAQYQDFKDSSCLKQDPLSWTCMSLHIQRFDSGWYTSIANHGHERFAQPGQFYLADDGKTPQYSNYAFFPLYPLLASGVVFFTGLNTRVAMLCLAIALAAINALLFFRFALHYLKDRSRAYWALAFFFLMPFQFYHHVALTEPLFILGLILAFSGILMRQWWELALGAFILTLTRPNGLFIGLPLLLFYLEVTQSWGLIGNWFRGRERFAFNHVWPQHWPLLIFLVFPVCFFSYCFYLQYMTGDFFAFQTAMKMGWGRSFDYPWKSLFRKGDLMEQFLSFYVTGFMVLTLVFIRQLNPAFLTLIAITIFMPVSTGTLLSIQRYMCILFPFAFIFVDILYRLPEFTQRFFFLAVMLYFHIWSYGLFIQENWIAC
jgi:hypothetical protein